MDVKLSIRVMELGEKSYVAATNLGGVLVRSGAVTETPVEAVRQLFAQVANFNGDTSIGLTLALQGKTIDDLSGDAAELTGGE